MSPDTSPSSAGAEALERAGSFWSARDLDVSAASPSWWHQPEVVKHINERICGEPVGGPSGGDLILIGRHLAGPALPRGISVGCGTGQKEMGLLNSGLVEHFDLYEIAESRVAVGREFAASFGLTERITWHQEAPAFSEPPEPFDLVYWNNALHHMFDVSAALEWSRAALRNGGLFYMNDFVGPDRMQWSAEMLRAANRVRTSLPRRLFKGLGPRSRLFRKLSRPKPARMQARDPTECADSAAILPGLERVFPEAEVTLTGGVVYHMALQGLFANLQPGDSALLERLLAVDDELTERGLTNYAVAVAELPAGA